MPEPLIDLPPTAGPPATPQEPARPAAPADSGPRLRLSRETRERVRAAAERAELEDDEVVRLAVDLLTRTAVEPARVRLAELVRTLATETEGDA